MFPLLPERLADALDLLVEFSTLGEYRLAPTVAPVPAALALVTPGGALVPLPASVSRCRRRAGARTALGARPGDLGGAAMGDVPIARDTPAVGLGGAATAGGVPTARPTRGRGMGGAATAGGVAPIRRGGRPPGSARDPLGPALPPPASLAGRRALAASEGADSASAQLHPPGSQARQVAPRASTRLKARRRPGRVTPAELRCLGAERRPAR